MNKLRFTTGFQGIDGPETSRIVDANGECVARFYTPWALPERLAMAAAPEMLEALELAIVALGQMGGNMADGPYRKEWLACRDAIRKASVRE